MTNNNKKRSFFNLQSTKELIKYSDSILESHEGEFVTVQNLLTAKKRYTNDAHMDNDDTIILTIITKDIEGWLVANEGDITVALDISISDDLRLEGIAREIVSKIQNLRKTKYFEVTDRIDTVISSDQDTEDAIKKNLDYVKTETLSNSIIFDKIDYDADKIQFENKVIKIFINKI